MSFPYFSSILTATGILTISGNGESFIKKANHTFMFGIFTGLQQMYYLFFREDRGKFKLLTWIQFTGENHFRPKYIFVEKTAGGSKQPAFIPAYPMFPLDKIEVVDKVFLD